MWQLAIYCHRRPPDAMPLLTQNGFWGSGTPATSFRWFHLHLLCGATLFGSHNLHLSPSAWHSLVLFCLLTSVCNAWQRSRTQNLQRVLENPVCGPKFMKFWHNVRDPSSFPAPLPDCLCHISFRRHSPLSVEVIEEPNKCKSFLAPIFSWGTTPTAAC